MIPPGVGIGVESDGRPGERRGDRARRQRAKARLGANRRRFYATRATHPGSRPAPRAFGGCGGAGVACDEARGESRSIPDSVGDGCAADAAPCGEGTGLVCDASLGEPASTAARWPGSAGVGVARRAVVRAAVTSPDLGLDVVPFDQDVALGAWLRATALRGERSWAWRPGVTQPCGERCRSGDYVVLATAVAHSALLVTDDGQQADQARELIGIIGRKELDDLVRSLSTSTESGFP